MKILYLTPVINDEGGVARVLSIKTNYLIEKYKYQVAIITQNQDNSPLFFEFNNSIELYNIPRSKGKLQNYISYRKQVQKLIAVINPDYIVVCDFGYKGFLLPFFITTKAPLFFEAHGSLFNESQLLNDNFFIQIGQRLKYALRSFCVKKFDAFIALSKESLNEWKVKKGIVIPNPNWITTSDNPQLNSKKIIVVARHSYEKGLDRLLEIWKEVSVNHLDWTLEIYGNKTPKIDLLALASKLNITSSVFFHKPEKDIITKYLESSIYLMTSRSEGFPMVLIEAMSCGLPVIAFDCPIGPRAIIDNNKNGFLIEDENYSEFISKLDLLIKNLELRAKMGASAKVSVAKYTEEIVMKQWDDLFKNFEKY